MRIALFGAGAVGSHIAARLIRSGVTLSVVARGATLQALRRDGLTLLEGTQRAVLPVTAIDRAEALGAQDLVIVAVKATQIDAAINDIRPLIGPETRALFAMNGLPWWFAHSLPPLAREALQPQLDPAGRRTALIVVEQGIWGVVTAGALLEAPAVVRSTTPAVNRMVLGYPDDRRDAVIDAAAAMLGRAGFEVVVAPRIREAIWSKLLVNAGQAMVAVATDRDHLAVTSDPETRLLSMALIRELVAIGQGIGLDPVADPVAMTDPARYGRHIPSFLQDLRAERPLELETTILAARTISRALGIPTPHLDSVAAIVAARSTDAAARTRSVANSRIEGGDG